MNEKDNELKKRARKARKKQKGMSPFSSFNTNAGNPADNANAFNHAMGSSSGCGVSGGCGVGEALEMLEDIDDETGNNNNEYTREHFDEVLERTLVEYRELLKFLEDK